MPNSDRCVYDGYVWGTLIRILQEGGVLEYKEKLTS